MTSLQSHAFRTPSRPADSLFQSVGGTPLVRIANIARGQVPAGVEIWAKLEGLNPGGSVKDRAALNMLRTAERTGRLQPGGRILDASSGNTGIALAMLAARRGYALTLCLPANVNAERLRTLRAYGADVRLTSEMEGSDGAIVEARGLAAEDPSLLYLDQYGNAANWRAHFEGTGPEIWAQTEGRVTHFVAALGTSGTFMGTTRYLKGRNPKLEAHSVEPESALHGLEGLKHMASSIVPPIYDPHLADEQLAAPTEESLVLVRELACREGLLVGPSSGAALWGALQVARRLRSGLVVAVFPDGGSRYLSEDRIWQPEAEPGPAANGR
ncbi:MAG: cysteine synthase family protein [Proteobacteria bacterium]|nr:cysteine synthase family protein [Pseudomonadota bacterium]